MRVSFVGHAAIARALFLVCLLLGTTVPSRAAVISVGAFPELNPAPSIPNPTGTFLVPVEISGAVNLQTWQFDLLFDASVVEVVDPLDGSSGIYGAEFTPGDPNSLSFILAGFPPFVGMVDDIAGSYPFLIPGPSGDGVLAYVLFQFLPGQEGNNPNFSIANESVFQVPEPSSLSLLAAVLLLFAFMHRRLSRARLPLNTHFATTRAASNPTASPLPGYAQPGWLSSACQRGGPPEGGAILSNSPPDLALHPAWCVRGSSER